MFAGTIKIALKLQGFTTKLLLIEPLSINNSKISKIEVLLKELEIYGR